MQKITMTQEGRTYLDLDSEPHHHLPILPQLQRTVSCTQMTQSRSSQPPLNIFKLRNALNDDTVLQLHRIRQHANHKAYRSIKQELLTDISNHRHFLANKADSMTRKILQQDDRATKNVAIQVVKARNYISKIIKDYNERAEENGVAQKQIKDKILKNALNRY